MNIRTYDQLVTVLSMCPGQLHTDLKSP